MKRIGIITCCKEPNYGACLQAHATQSIITEMGYEAEIIDYSFLEEKSYLPYKQKSFSSACACILFFHLRKSLYKAFKSFHSIMKFSPKAFHGIEDFVNAINEYDVFLVGSDQVWNPFLGIDTNVTLLNFYDKGPKRISYASSFGVSFLPESEEDKYAKALGKFNSLSVREISGQKIVSKLLKKEVPVVLDPTLLLDRFQWKKYEGDYVPNDPYLLIYDMQHTKELINFAVKMAKKRGWKVYALSRVILKNRHVKVLSGISPADFLSLINHAQFIITDSFHGTIFSINYHKEFFVYCGSGGKKLSSRITNILCILNLNNRLLKTFVQNDTLTPIDYKSIDQKLNQLKYDSLQYLSNSLKEAINDDKK